MAYTFNGDMASSVLECGQAMYDKFIDENSNFHSGGTIQDGNTYTWNDDYVGIGKNNYYYYRYYGATRNNQGSTDDYSLLFGAFRTPFNINDEIIRPFFIKPVVDNNIYPLYVGVKENKGKWNFTNNRYGSVNHSIDTSLLDNTNYVTSLLRYSLIRGSNSNNTIKCLSSGVGKTSYFNISLNSSYSRYIMSIGQGGYSPTIYSYGY